MGYQVGLTDEAQADLGAVVRRRPGTRKLTHRHYLIFYQVNDTAHWVEVVRIWDGRQNPASLRLP